MPYKGTLWDVKKHQNWLNVDTFFCPFPGEITLVEDGFPTG